MYSWIRETIFSYTGLFGAEVIVEAIAIESVDESFYVTEYYVEYASNVSHYCCIYQLILETPEKMWVLM